MVSCGRDGVRFAGRSPVIRLQHNAATRARKRRLQSSVRPARHTPAVCEWVGAASLLHFAEHCNVEVLRSRGDKCNLSREQSGKTRVKESRVAQEAVERGEIRR